MFRFTIRDVLWLTVVVGMGCAWWLGQRQKQPMALLDALKFRGDVAVADVRAVKDGDKISVFFMYGDGRSDKGKIVGTYPGGYTKYVLTKRGETVQIIGGE